MTKLSQSLWLQIVLITGCLAVLFGMYLQWSGQALIGNSFLTFGLLTWPIDYLDSYRHRPALLAAVLAAIGLMIIGAWSPQPVSTVCSFIATTLFLAVLFVRVREHKAKKQAQN